MLLVVLWKGKKEMLVKDVKDEGEEKNGGKLVGTNLFSYLFTSNLIYEAVEIFFILINWPAGEPQSRPPPPGPCPASLHVFSVPARTPTRQGE